MSEHECDGLEVIIRELQGMREDISELIDTLEGADWRQQEELEEMERSENACIE